MLLLLLPLVCSCNPLTLYSTVATRRFLCLPISCPDPAKRLACPCQSHTKSSALFTVSSFGTHTVTLVSVSISLRRRNRQRIRLQGRNKPSRQPQGDQHFFHSFIFALFSFQQTGHLAGTLFFFFLFFSSLLLQYTSGDFRNGQGREAHGSFVTELAHTFPDHVTNKRCRPGSNYGTYILFAFRIVREPHYQEIRCCAGQDQGAKKKTSGDVHRANVVEISLSGAFCRRPRPRNLVCERTGRHGETPLSSPTPTLPSLLTWHILIHIQTYKTNVQKQNKK